MKMQWQIQVITANIDKYFISIERQRHDGKYRVRTDIWDDKRGYHYYDDFTEDTLIEAKSHIERLMEMRML
jgi:hypothetical protein